jgi:hypothetical protein
MKPTSFIITLIAAFTIGSICTNLGITFAQEKNETSEFNDSSPLITIKDIDESMETNNTLSQKANNTSIFK